MYKYFLCIRYLRTRYIALASIVSVTLGVATMIVVNAVMFGFTTEMRERIHGILSDVVFESRSMEGMRDADLHMEEIRRVVGDDIESLTPTVIVPGMLSFQFRGEYITQPIQVIGIDAKTQSEVSSFPTYLQHPENRIPGADIFTLREGGFDTQESPEDEAQGLKPRRQLRDAGWPRRRRLWSPTPGYSYNQPAPSVQLPVIGNDPQGAAENPQPASTTNEQPAPRETSRAARPATNPLITADDAEVRPVGYQFVVSDNGEDSSPPEPRRIDFDDVTVRPIGSRPADADGQVRAAQALLPVEPSPDALPNSVGEEPATPNSAGLYINANPNLNPYLDIYTSPEPATENQHVNATSATVETGAVVDENTVTSAVNADETAGSERNAAPPPDAPTGGSLDLGDLTGSAPPEMNPFDARPESHSKYFDPRTQQHEGVVLGIGLSCRRLADGSEGFLILPGDDIQITLPTAGTPPKGISDSFTVVDFYESKMSEYDSSFVFVPIDHIQKLRGMIDPTSGAAMVTQIQIKLKEGADLTAVRDRLRAAFPGHLYLVSTWQDKQGALLAAVRMETAILNVLLFMIIAVAGFGILAIFLMIVVEKTRDIGILKALGASSRGIMGIFLSYGLMLGVVGSSAGLILGLLFVGYINEIADLLGRVTGQPVFDPKIYYFYKIPAIVDTATVCWIMFGAIGIAVLSSVLPAIRAAMLHPVEALRYE